jgi:broad specificity phosphatase PhoE
LAQNLHDLAESKVNIVEDLRELDLGLWSGLRRDELEKRFERAGTQWLDDPASVSPPSGETIADLESRLVPVIEKAISRRRTATNIAVVLRPIAYACLRCRLEQAPTTAMREYFEDPAPPPPIWFEIVRDDPRLVLAPAPSREADRQVPAA